MPKLMSRLTESEGCGAGCSTSVLLPAEPTGAPPPDGSPATINAYYQQSSTFNRFVWTVRFLCRNGFFVIIDNHTEVKTADLAIST